MVRLRRIQHGHHLTLLTSFALRAAGASLPLGERRSPYASAKSKKKKAKSRFQPQPDLPLPAWPVPQVPGHVPKGATILIIREPWIHLILDGSVMVSLAADSGDGCALLVNASCERFV